jgi:hypothetical protein
MKAQDVDIVWRWAGSASRKKLKKFADIGINIDALPEYTDDLKYSMRSVFENMKWFNKAFVLVDDDEVLPKWLNINNTKIVIVRHSQFIPFKCLPTCNSNIIDSYIHHVPGLAENFIALDDEMFICKKIPRSKFFDRIKGVAINRHYIGKNLHTLKQHPYLFVKMWQDQIKKYKLKYSRIQHQAMPFQKSTMMRYEHLFLKNDMKNMQGNRTRTYGDVNLLRFSTAMASTLKEATVQKTHESDEIFIEGSNVADKDIRKICKKRPTFLCINNTHEKMDKVYELLQLLFPIECNAEKCSKK